MSRGNPGPSERGFRAEVERRIELARELVPWAYGIGVGSITFVVGYVTFFGVVVAGASRVSFDDLNVLGKTVGRLFFNAHNVPNYERTRLLYEPENSPEQYVVQEGLVNGLTGQVNTSIPVEVYYIVPVTVLVVAGFVFARRFVPSRSEARRGTLLSESLAVGAAVGLGYLLVALVCTFLFASKTGGPDTYHLRQPSQVHSLVFGALYPLVWTTLGALVNGYQRQS